MQKYSYFFIIYFDLSQQVTTPQPTTIEHASDLSMALEYLHPEFTNSKAPVRFQRGVRGRLIAQLIEVNKELWLILSMIMITSDRPYRKAMSPFDAKDIIEKGSGTEFDPEVVEVFLKVFAKGELEIPNVVL